MNLYAIQISKITNPYLIERGWKVGDFVCLYHSAYGGDTFGLPDNQDELFVCFSAKRAEKELRNRGDHFGEVEFQIVSFVQPKSSDQDTVKCSCGKRDIAREDGPAIIHDANVANSKIPPHTTHHDWCPCRIEQR